MSVGKTFRRRLYLQQKMGERTNFTQHVVAIVHFHAQSLLLFSWVAYEKPGFEGHQYLLEEGEYRDWTDWGGYDEELQSLRPVVGVSSKNVELLSPEHIEASRSFLLMALLFFFF